MKKTKKKLKEKGIVGPVLVVAMLVSLIIASLPVIPAAEVKFTNSGSAGVLRGEGAGSSRTTMSAGQSAEIAIEVDYEVTVEPGDTHEKFSFKKKGSNSASDPDHGIEVAVDGRVSISGSVRENGTASAGARVHAEGREMPPAEADQTGLWVEADVSTYARAITGDDGTAKAKSAARGKAEGEGSWAGVGDIFADVSGRSESFASSRDLSEAWNLAGLMGYADLSTAESFNHYDEATIYSDSTASGTERAKADGSASGRATASFIAAGEGTTLDAASYTEGKRVTSSADARNEGSAFANAFVTSSSTILDPGGALALVHDISAISVATDTGGTQANSYASAKAAADADTSSEAEWKWDTDTWLLESATGASGKAKSKSTIRGIASAESMVLTESEGSASADQLSDTSQVKIESEVSVTASKAFTEGWVKKATTSARSLYSAGEDEDPIAESKTMVEAKGATGRISARNGEADALVWVRGDQVVGPDPTDPTNTSVYAFSMVYTNVSATDESRAYPSAVLKSAQADVFAYHNDSLEAASWVIDGSGKSYLKPRRDIGYSLTSVVEASAEGDQCLGAQNHYIVTNEEPNQAYSYTWTLGASYIGAVPPIFLPIPPIPPPPTP